MEESIFDFMMRKKEGNGIRYCHFFIPEIKKFIGEAKASKLENEVLNIIGLSVDRGKIFDIDKGQYLLFNGKFIYVEDSSLLIHKNDIKFNIINNVKLYIFLILSYYFLSRVKLKSYKITSLL